MARLSGAKPWTEVEPANCCTGNEVSDVAVAAVVRYLLYLGGGWQIDSAKTVDKPGWTRC